MSDRPHIILILTDDQPAHTMWAMPLTTALLGGRGVTYERAYVTTPLCCPNRASVLAGGFYAQDTGVLGNHPPNGGVQMFNASHTLNLALQRAGYHTGLIGVKVMNGDGLWSPAILPGWSRYEIFDTEPRDREGRPPQSWNAFWNAQGSSTDRPGTATLTYVEQYITDYTADRAIAFLQEAPADKPWFLFLNFNAPHWPATPEAEDADAFPGYLATGRSIGEADVSDKPALIRHAALGGYNATQAALPGDMLRTLQSVDRAIERIHNELAASGDLDNTLIAFSSDNGFMTGEHGPAGRAGIHGKGHAYEESVRVPLIMAYPGGAQGVTRPWPIAANLEVPATILAAAGLPKPVYWTQGLDQTAALLGNPAPECRRDRIILQHWTDTADDEDRPGRKGWAAVVEGWWKYVLHDTDEVELYDLAADPFEMENVAGVEANGARCDDLRAKLVFRTGVTMATITLPPATVGQPYAAPIVARGGKAPYYWLADSRMPPGLRIDRITGHVLGTPTAAGAWHVLVHIYSAAVRAQAGGPQQFVREFALTVGA